MNSNQILQSDVLDIIFENKNKLYGAYELRKHYNQRLIKAIGISMLVLLGFLGFSFINKPADEIIYPVVEISTHILPPDKLKETKTEKKQEKREETIIKPSNQNPPTTTVIVDHVVNRDTIAINSIIDFGPTNNPNGGTSTVVLPPSEGSPGGTGDGTTTKPSEVKPVEVKPDIPLEVADVYPEFPGGIKALQRFLEKNLSNPKDMEEGEEVAVKVRFVVGVDGKLKSFDIVKDGGAEFNNEVIRVLKKMPNWNPGKSNGRDVAVYREIPIKFIPAN